MAGQTRIHIDDVEGLGAFLELEAVLGSRQSAEQGLAAVARLMALLEIEERDLVDVAYIDLLEAEEATGVRLTGNFAMAPAASVAGLYFAHPAARYFSLGKIGSDQLEAYAARKGIAPAEAAKWLGPNLV